MRRMFWGLLFPVWLCTCGPAQDNTAPAEAAERIDKLERVFNGAYQELDAAVIDRLLADDYAVEYSSGEPGKSREQFIGELGQLSLIFPQLNIEIDSSRVENRGDTVMVTGIRTFNWKTSEGPGSYREEFLNKWMSIDDRWRLVLTQLQPLT